MINFYVLAEFSCLHENKSWQTSALWEVEEASHSPYHLSYPNVTETIRASSQNLTWEWKRPIEMQEG